MCFHFLCSCDVVGFGKSVVGFDWVCVGKDLGE